MKGKYSRESVGNAGEMRGAIRLTEILVHAGVPHQPGLVRRMDDDGLRLLDGALHLALRRSSVGHCKLATKNSASVGNTNHPLTACSGGSEFCLLL